MSSEMAVLPQTKRDKLATVRDLLERSRGQIAAALPRHLTPERMMRVAMTAVQTTPALLDCDPRSVIASVVQAAQLGLEVGVMGQAYLVPYKSQAQLIVGYRGLLALARRSGDLASFEARVVHQGDKFSFSYGTDAGLHHQPALEGEPGPVLCAYAVARLKSGEWATEVMTASQIDAIRKRSRASGSGPWVTDYEEMARKTVARRLLKWLPMSIELQTALEVEDQAEVGAAPLELAHDVTPGRVDKLAARVRAAAAAPQPQPAPVGCTHEAAHRHAASHPGKVVTCVDCGEEVAAAEPPQERVPGEDDGDEVPAVFARVPKG